MAIAYAAPFVLLAAVPVVLTGCGSGGSGDSSSGQVKWTKDLAGPLIKSTPAVGPDGTVYVGATNHSDGFFCALNSEDGSTKWTFQTNLGIESTPAVGVDGTVFFVSGGQLDGYWESEATLWAISGDGHLKWQYNQSQYSPALGADGTVFVVANHSLTALDSDDGTVKWALSSDAISASPFIGADGTVFAISGSTGSSIADPFYGGDAAVLALHPEDGSIKWRTAVECDGEKSDGARSMSMGTEGTLLVSNVCIHALNASNGHLKWNGSYAASKHPLPETVSGILVPLSPVTSSADGNMYFSSRLGWLYAVSGDDGSLLQRQNMGQPCPGTWGCPPGNIWGRPALSTDGTMYVGTDDFFIHAIKLSDWSLLWSHKAHGWVKGGPAVGSDGTVYVGSDSTVYALQGEGGPVSTPGAPLLEVDLAV